jgi:N-acetylmuramoyl-L-alanine amidase
MRRSLVLARWLVAALAGLVGAGCKPGGAQGVGDAGGGDGSREAGARALALLSPSVTLPPRAEVVALADQVAIDSSRAGKSAEGARLATVAARLRARSYRVDGAGADAREAVELYRAATQALTGEAACRVDLERALFAGDVAHDARELFREVYLVQKRWASSLAPRGSFGDSECLTRASRALSLVDAHRPSPEALAALEASAQGPSPSPAASPPSAASALAAGAPTAPSPAPREVVASLPADRAKGPAKLTQVETFASDKGARVVLHLSSPTTFEVGALAADAASGRDERVYLDLAKTSAKGVRDKEVGGVLRRVRVGAHKGATRVVLDLQGKLFRRVFFLPEPFRVVVDLSTRAPERDEAPAPGKPRTVRRVALDAGHGGHDAGAVGPTGLREKDVTLDVAHRVAPLLAHELGIETVLTRDSDAFVPLEIRTARANAFHADLFVSVHCNATVDGAARGVTTYVFDRVKEGDASALKLASRENGLGKAEAQLGTADLELLLPTLNPKGHAERSRHLAELLQRSTLASLTQRYPDLRDLGVRTAGFYVLAGAEMPAVLFETSFISNGEDEKRLNTADYRQKLADAIVNAVRAYKEGK